MFVKKLVAVGCLLLAVEFLEAKNIFRHKKTSIIEGPPQSESECEDGYRKCPASSRCVRASWFCDGDNDCGDDSDEQNCTPRECPDEMIKCPTRNRCIEPDKLCDGENNCVDNSDEQNCENRECAEGALRCKDGQCIDKHVFCSGYKTCGDGTQFPDVICPDITCEPDYRKCPRLSKCIQSRWFCDGDNDCGDMSDEPDNCRERQCEEGEFRCYNGQCITLTSICMSGTPGCRDDTITTLACTNFQCPEGYGKCVSDGKCIRSEYLCDGSRNCEDGSDEAAHHCATPLVCSNPDYVSCPNTRRCINKRYFCDTDNDCGDNSDEEESFCSFRTCPPDEVRCNNGQCIDKDAFCGSVYSCRDDSLSISSELCGEAAQSQSQPIDEGALSPDMECYRAVVQMESTCMAIPFLEEMISLGPEAAYDKLVEIDMQELCGVVQQPLQCVKNTLSAACSAVDNPLTSVVALAERLFDLVCVQEINTINRHKACLLRKDEKQPQPVPLLLTALENSCEQFITPEIERNSCISDNLKACVKNVVGEQCGDEIAGVIASSARQFACFILP